MEVRADFVGDLAREALRVMRSAGYSATMPAGPEGAIKVLRRFYELVHRHIARSPRRLLLSRELSERGIPEHQREAIGRIEAASLAGESLRPFQSRRLANLEENDLLLNDWRIQHLHLGPPGLPFVGRTKELLFVYIHFDRLLAIDIRSHGGWSDGEIFEIVHSNWPDAIKEFRVTPATETPRASISAAERSVLRPHVTMVTVVRDGTVYLPPGRGVTIGGGSARAGLQANHALRVAWGLEAKAQKHARLIASWVSPDSSDVQFIKLNLRLGDAVIRDVFETKGELPIRIMHGETDITNQVASLPE